MRRKLSRAFTVLEMLVVIAIIAILIAMLYPAVSGMQERGKITQDMNNMRQLGVATQMYLNDNDGAFFLSTENWMQKLHPKYLGGWKVFQSPFDKRPPSENNTSAPISYGLNVNAHGTSASDPLLSDKILDSSRFILFAPAQAASTTMPFAGTANTAPQNVSKDSAGPRGAAAGGTHNSGRRINACFGDLHSESMAWEDFHSDAPDAGSSYTVSARWHPDPANP